MQKKKLNIRQGEQITIGETVTPADPGPDKDAPTVPEATITKETHAWKVKGPAGAPAC